MAIEKDCNKRRNKEWCEWRKAKKMGKLTEHRRQLKREATRKDFRNFYLTSKGYKIYVLNPEFSIKSFYFNLR